MLVVFLVALGHSRVALPSAGEIAGAGTDTGGTRLTTIAFVHPSVSVVSRVSVGQMPMDVEKRPGSVEDEDEGEGDGRDGDGEVKTGEL